jgi:hypothetical protein
MSIIIQSLILTIPFTILLALFMALSILAIRN